MNGLNPALLRRMADAQRMLDATKHAREAQRRYAAVMDALRARRALGIDPATMRILHRACMVIRTARVKLCQRRARPRSSHAIRRRAGASSRTGGADPPDDPERTAAPASTGGAR